MGLVAGHEIPSKERFHAEHVKKVPRHNTCLHALRFFAAQEHERHLVILNERRECLILAAIVLDVMNGKK